MAYKLTQYGFIYNDRVAVQRLCSDNDRGDCIEIIGARERVVVRVTPGGRIRVESVTKYGLQDSEINAPPVEVEVSFTDIEGHARIIKGTVQ